MSIILCELQLGDAAQQIYLVNNNQTTKMTSVPMDELGDALIAMASCNKVDKIILRGVHEYALRIVDKLVNSGLTVEIK